MNSQCRDEIKSIIREELARLERDIAALAELTDPAALDGLDEIARMDAIVSKSVHEASLTAARNKKIALKYTLKRMEADDDFGYCMECGEEIPLPRLKSVPEATRCVHCAK